jgi:hypothetical protein
MREAADMTQVSNGAVENRWGKQPHLSVPGENG